VARGDADAAHGRLRGRRRRPPELLRRSNTDRQAIHFSQEQLAPVIVGSFLGNYWPAANEIATAAPARSPVEYANFRHTVLQVTLRLRVGEIPRVTVGGRWTDRDEPAEISGRVVESKQQGMVEPTTNKFPSPTLARRRDRRRQDRHGGRAGAFVEDIEADLVRIEEDDGDHEEADAGESDEADGADGV